MATGTGAGGGGGGCCCADVLSDEVSSSRKTSCRKLPPASPPGSVPRVFSQLEVNRAQWPSGEMFGRGSYQKYVVVASRSLRTSDRWCAKRHTVASVPAGASVWIATSSSSQARQ